MTWNTKVGYRAYWLPVVETCVVCKRNQMHPSEGRIADGSWAADADLLEEYKGKWFCCFNCYDKVLREAEKNGGES